MTGTLLCYTPVKFNDTEIFRDLLKAAKKDHPELEDVFRHMGSVPKILNSIVNGTYQTHFLKNAFLRIFKDKKTKEGKKKGDVLLKSNVTRWLSTYKVIERSLFFREQITGFLKEAKAQPKVNHQSYKLVPLSIQDVTWDHLSTIFGILKLFV